jgi:hypothetical protein
MSRGRFAELLLALPVSQAVAKLRKMSLAPMYFHRFLISVKHGCQRLHPDLCQTWRKQRQIKSGWGSNQIDTGSHAATAVTLGTNLAAATALSPALDAWMVDVPVPPDGGVRLRGWSPDFKRWRRRGTIQGRFFFFLKPGN